MRIDNYSTFNFPDTLQLSKDCRIAGNRSDDKILIEYITICRKQSFIILMIFGLSMISLRVVNTNVSSLFKGCDAVFDGAYIKGFV